MRRIPSGAPILTAEAMRAAEAAAFARGVPQSELMATAGLAVAREVHRHALRRPILVLAGPGNNGGDAYVAARWLAAWSHDVMVASLGEPRDGAAREAFDGWSGARVSIEQADPRPVLVDGLFGTGLARPLDDGLQQSLAPLAQAAEVTIAIDLPSGVDTDSGEPLGCMTPATATVAFGALKPAHLLGQGAGLSGRVVLADLGIPIARDWTSLAAPRGLAAEPHAHKYSRGLVLVVGGAMPGAARLTARAAARAGAGYVWLASESGKGGGIDSIVAKKLTEDADIKHLIADERIGSVVVGPGLGRNDRAQRLLNAAIASALPLVLDGDALSLLGEAAADRISPRRAPTILTPHSGEFDRMFGKGRGSKIDRTLTAAEASGATIVQKGPDTVIADPAGRIVVSAAAPSTLATAGSGDVLAGIVAARLAAGDAPASQAAPSAAAWLHMRAAEYAGPGLVADDLVDRLPGAMAEVW